MRGGLVQPGVVPQAVEKVRREPGDLLQAAVHRQEPSGGHVPDRQRLRAGRGHRSGQLL